MALDAPHAGTSPLTYEHCQACGHAQLPLAAVCLRCRSRSLSQRISAGLGSIYSFTAVHRAPTPAFEQAVPYTLILVDLDEGFRLMTNLEGVARHSAAIGDRVEVKAHSTPGSAPTYAHHVAPGAR